MKIINKKAFFDYEILEKIEAGIQLSGPEVKSVKGGHMNFEGAYVRLVGSEAYLVNAQIFPYNNARPPAGGESYEPRRTRKLLLHKKELLNLKIKLSQSNLTLVPIECYNKDNFVKLLIGLAKGKKKYEKREAIKRKDLQRNIEEELRGK